MNVKKLALWILLGLLAGLSAGCSGAAGPTPTRTPRAVAENGSATQTPWIIYVPVTATPEPFTVTPLPTVTSNAPLPPTAKPAQPTRTKAPATARPAQATSLPANSPTAAPPPASPTAVCGPYAVAALTFPENGVTRTTKANPGGGMAIIFKFTPAVSYKLDPKIGYMLLVKAKANSASRYISHNQFLADGQMVLDQNAVYNLTLPGGDDTAVSWTITPIMASGGFDDLTFGPPTGTVTPCGPATGPWNIYLHVQ